jgi:hypothetical protein
VQPRYPVRYRRKRIGIGCLLGRGVRPFPAANLGVKFLAVFASDSVVHRPAVL